jgi:ABC-type multidrug transport system ATPase subunit
MTQAIVASELTRYHGDLLAVDHANFEVQPGEIFGYLGPNGAGKTTTIKLLTGLLRPTHGTATVNGYDILHDAHGVKRSIGVTIFLTTHYIEEADQLCDRVAIINEGRIVSSDAPEKLKSSILGEHTIEVSFDGGNGRGTGGLECQLQAACHALPAMERLKTEYTIALKQH